MIIDLFSHYRSYFPASLCAWKLPVAIYHKFYLVGCQIFVNIFEFCSGLKLNYLKTLTFDLFRTYFKDLLYLSRAVLSLGLIIPHYWARFFCVPYPVPHKSWTFVAQFVGTGTIPSPVLSTSKVSLNPFVWFLVRPLVVSWHACNIEYSAEYSKGTICRSPGIFLCSSHFSSTLSC